MCEDVIENGVEISSTRSSRVETGDKSNKSSSVAEVDEEKKSHAEITD
jgi:hypothetical protein